MVRKDGYGDCGIKDMIAIERNVSVNAISLVDC